MYRPISILPEAGYTLSFVEFDDRGELWSRDQVEQAVDFIRRANETEAGAFVIVAAHGWNNNASPKQEAMAEKTLGGFKLFLDQVAERVHVQHPGKKILAVYLGWRGKNARGPFQFLTFYNRRRTANRIAGTSAIAVLSEIVANAKTNEGSRVMVIGHSFGGLIVERMIQLSTVDDLVGARTGDMSLAVDLTVLFNPASSSIEAKQLVDILSSNHVSVKRVLPDSTWRSVPLIVSITSIDDVTTRLGYPISALAGTLSTRFRTYPPEECSPLPRQRLYYKRTAGHNRSLHSHTVTASERSLPPEEPVVLGEYGEFQFDVSDRRYEVTRRRGAFNNTPYWIMRVPGELIPSHSEIFTEGTFELLKGLLAVSGVIEPEGRTQLERRPGLQVVSLRADARGGLVYVDRSRRIYRLARGASKSEFLACVPEGLDVGAAIGGSPQGESMRMVQSVRSEQQDQFDTEIFDLTTRSSQKEASDPREIESEVHYLSSAEDTTNARLFLAHKNGIDVVSISNDASLVPKPWAEARLLPPPGGVAIDPARDRLLVLDSIEGQLLSFSLSSPSSGPRIIAQGFDRPADLGLDRTTGSIYVADPGAKTLWRVPVQIGSANHLVPERFRDDLDFPASVDVEPDGTVWVVEVGAGRLLALDRSGEWIRSFPPDLQQDEKEEFQRAPP